MDSGATKMVAPPYFATICRKDVGLCNSLNNQPAVQMGKVRLRGQQKADQDDEATDNFDNGGNPLPGQPPHRRF